MKGYMQKKIFINDLPVVVSNAVLCSLLNISKQNFQQWQLHQSFPKDAKVKYGFYDLQRVIEFRDIYIYGDAEIAKEIQKEKLKYQIARSERERLETAKLQGILVEKERLLKKFTETIIVAKDALLLLPKTLPPSIGVDHATQKLITFGLDREIKRILRVWASGIEAIKSYTEENSKNELEKIRTKNSEGIERQAQQQRRKF